MQDQLDQVLKNVLSCANSCFQRDALNFLKSETEQKFVFYQSKYLDTFHVCFFFYSKIVNCTNQIIHPDCQLCQLDSAMSLFYRTRSSVLHRHQ